MKSKEDESAAPQFSNEIAGVIPTGTTVEFMVENQDQWAGDLTGALVYQDGEFKIKTKRSGVLTINKGYDVYMNTIKPV